MTNLLRDNVSERQATVLVVDSDVLVRIVIAGYLRDCVYRVIEAATADEAMAILGEGNIEIDVALIDVELHGGLDGFGLGDGFEPTSLRSRLFSRAQLRRRSASRRISAKMAR